MRSSHLFKRKNREFEEKDDKSKLKKVKKNKQEQTSVVHGALQAKDDQLSILPLDDADEGEQLLTFNISPEDGSFSHAPKLTIIDKDDDMVTSVNSGQTSEMPTPSADVPDLNIEPPQASSGRFSLYYADSEYSLDSYLRLSKRDQASSEAQDEWSLGMM